MSTYLEIKMVALIILDELKVLRPYIRNQAETGSIYIKFREPLLRSIRISDHPGRSKYKYKWNIRCDIDEPFTEEDHGITRHYFPPDQIDLFLDEIKKFNVGIVASANGDWY